MTALALVGLGGALGSVARYLVGVAAARWLGDAFPYGTLLVNLAGSFAIGLVHEMLMYRVFPETVRLLLITGVLGGFTTYSAFSYETVRLAATGIWVAVAYAGGTTLLCLALSALGLSVARWLAGAG